ncbi:MAG: hypothetical protein E7040_02550 [Lentisphaerae bacterium]|nr:hypothetical protein [Lentisphaerota bacterium]
MKVTINKNEIVSALTALGKNICRTSPVTLYKSLRINTFDGEIKLATCKGDEEVTFTTGVETVGTINAVVLFDEFREALKSCRAKTVEIAWENRMLKVGECYLEIQNESEWPVIEMNDSATSCELPENVVAMFTDAAPIVNNREPRRILHGINISRSGLTVTNGRELLNFPLDLDFESTTVLLPLALIQSKATDSGRIYRWINNGSVYFRIDVGKWSWRGKALTGDFLNWKQIMPQKSVLTHEFRLTEEHVQRALTFLKSLPELPPHNAVEVSQYDGKLKFVQEEQTLSLAAEFTGDWSSYSFSINRDMLQRIFQLGHTIVKTSDHHVPIQAEGGRGIYITMPLYQRKPTVTQTVKEPETKENTTTEEPKMEMNHGMKIVSAPVQTPAQNQEPETSPLDELSISIEAFKLKIKTIADEASQLARKVKEAQIVQKQKEREFVQAKRAIERIRMAI